MVSDVSILIVEDNRDHRELVLSALSEYCDASRLLAVPDGETALAYLKGQGAYAGRDPRRLPRLLILDLKLGQLDGIGVLRAIRTDSVIAALPVVMLSATADKNELDSCYDAGANSVVRKSADYDELRRKMRQVHDFWLTVNESDRPSRV